MSGKGTNGIGLGVDRSGGPVVDPTANVIALTEAANKRQDDLREANDTLNAAKIKHLEDMVNLRAAYDEKLRDLESKRLDAIRQVDVLAVNTAADRANAAIEALAATTATNAENVRNALSTTAATIATQLASTVSAITERISGLEKSSYEGKGKGAGVNAAWGYLVAIVMAAVAIAAVFLKK